MSHSFPISLPNKNLFPVTRITKNLKYLPNIWPHCRGQTSKVSYFFRGSSLIWLLLMIFSHVLLCCLFFPLFAALIFLLHSTLLSDLKQLKSMKKDSSEKKKRRCFSKKWWSLCLCRPLPVVVLILMVFSICLSHWSKTFNTSFLTVCPLLFLLVVIQIVPLREQINACHEN